MGRHEDEMQPLIRAIRKSEESPLMQSLKKSRSKAAEKRHQEPTVETVAPIVQAAQQHQLRKAARQSLSGYQQAALRAGLRTDYPGLEKMTFEAMKKAAALERAERVRGISRHAGTEFMLNKAIADIQNDVRDPN
jgi:hypothetical protein